MKKDIVNRVKESAAIKILSLLLAMISVLYPSVLFAAGSMLSSSMGGFWRTYPSVEGLLICMMLAVFPRISLAYLSLVTGTFAITLLGIFGWILVPHVLVACIATTLYWNSDPVLVILAWFIAFSGEIVEKTVVRRRF